MSCPNLKADQSLPNGISIQACHIEEYANLERLNQVLLAEGDLGSLTDAKLHLPDPALGSEAQGSVFIQGDKFLAVLGYSGLIEILDMTRPDHPEGIAPMNFPVDACRFVKDAGSAPIFPQGKTCENITTGSISLQEGLETYWGVMTTHYLFKGFRLPVPGLRWVGSNGAKFYKEWWQGTRAFMGGGRAWFVNPWRWAKITPRLPHLVLASGQAATRTSRAVMGKTGFKSGGLGYLSLRLYEQIIGDSGANQRLANYAGPMAALFAPDIVRATFSHRFLLGRPAAAVGTALAGRFAGARVLAGGLAKGARAANVAGWVFLGGDLLGNAYFDDYEENLNERIYQDAYEETPFWWKPVRATGHFLVPTLYAGAIASDNPDYEKKISGQDRAVALQFKKDLPVLLKAYFNNYDVANANSFQSVPELHTLIENVELSEAEMTALNQFPEHKIPVLADAKLALLEKRRPELGYLDRAMFFQAYYQEELVKDSSLDKQTAETLEKMLAVSERKLSDHRQFLAQKMDWSEGELLAFERKVLLKKIQDGGRFAALVPGRHNQWADQFFDGDDGHLFNSELEALIQFAFPQKPQEMRAKTFVLQKRRIDVAMHTILGTQEYYGTAMDQVAKNAGVRNSNGSWRLNSSLADAYGILKRTVHALVDSGADQKEIDSYAKPMVRFAEQLVEQYQVTQDLTEKAVLKDFLENKLGLDLEGLLPQVTQETEPDFSLGL